MAASARTSGRRELGQSSKFKLRQATASFSALCPSAHSLHPQHRPVSPNSSTAMAPRLPRSLLAAARTSATFLPPTAIASSSSSSSSARLLPLRRSYASDDKPSDPPAPQPTSSQSDPVEDRDISDFEAFSFPYHLPHQVRLSTPSSLPPCSATKADPFLPLDLPCTSSSTLESKGLTSFPAKSPERPLTPPSPKTVASPP